jgi:DNA polymerase (family 10)
LSGQQPPDRFAIARALREIAMLLEARGANRFKTRAYERGARALEAFAGDLDALVRERRLTDVPGIGPALAERIAELHGTGRSEMLERLRAELPPGILELRAVPHLSPDRIAALHESLGVTTLAELQAACESGRVREVKGFGEKTERKILDGIRSLATREERVLLYKAVEEGERLLDYLRSSPATKQAELAGSVRRAVETVNNLDLVAASPSPARLLDHFAAYPMAVSLLERDRDSAAVRLAGGLNARLRIAPPKGFAALLFLATGSVRHLDKLQALYGPRLKGALAGHPGSEAEIYERMGLPGIAPEQREDEGEIEAAAAGSLPQDLVTVEDIQGLVHCHTVYSDGKHTVEQMARAAERMGMKYITITDHSPSAYYAGGLKLDRLRRQWADIESAQEKVKVKLLRGTESDILADGSLDYPDAVLKQLDVVIASIHNRHRMDADQMTRRIVRAMRQPVFKVWGHALGRYVLSRPPIAVHMDEVLDTVAASRAAVEINGDPHRLDMEPRWVRAARARGIRFVISTDAHSTGQLENVRYGVAMARRGWVRRSEVLNTLPAEAFQREVRP